MFVKTRRAKENGWSTYLNVSEVHTDRLAFEKFEEHANVQFDHESRDVRWNIKFPPSAEIDRIKFSACSVVHNAALAVIRRHVGFGAVFSQPR